MDMMSLLAAANGSTTHESSASEDLYPRSSADGTSDDVSTTLYFGNLHPFAQQRALEDLCGYFGHVESTKVIKDKGTGASAGYGFVKFTERKAAEDALRSLNGTNYMSQDLRVNWALPNSHKEDTSYHHHVFVGDLGSDVTDALLYNAFCTIGQCSDARVMWDHNTGRSKGYGFVSFRRREDAEAAIEKMNAELIGSRRIRVGWAQHKQDDSVAPADFCEIDRADPSNMNVYIGNIAPETADADLHAFFTAYGPVAEVKLHKKGGYGFVKYEAHESAVKAIVGQRGKELHGRVLKCSWGRNVSPCNRGNASASSALCQTLQSQGSRFINGQGLLNPGNNNQQAVASLAAAAATKAVTDAIGNMSVNHPSMGSLHLNALLSLVEGNGSQGMMQHPAVYNQSCMPQAMPQNYPMALAAQMMMMQGMQAPHDSRLLQQALLAALSSNLSGFNPALSNPMVPMEPMGLYSDAGMYGAGSMYGFGGTNAGMMLQ